MPILLLCCCSAGAFAQGTITGRIEDEKGKPVTYANVVLLNAGKNDALAQAVISDTNGIFTLTIPATGKYAVQATALGYKEYRSAIIEIADSNAVVRLGKISLLAEGKDLSEVTVTALRPTIEQKADRMVVSVEGTVMAAGNSAFTVLGKAPGVFIDAEGNIQLNGRSGVTVMLDGKLTYLSARDLRNLLEGMPAENIKNIEIITNPSAKYDAEGVSGILNINLKKNDRQGVNGSVYASTSYNEKHHGFTAGGNIFHKKGKFNSFLSLDAVRRVSGREATFTRVFYGPSKTTYFDQVATGNNFGQGPPSVRLGTDYSINAKHTIGFITSYATGKFESDFLTETYIGERREAPDQFIDADNFSYTRNRYFTGNVHYSGKLDTSGTTLSADMDYVKIRNKSESYFFNAFENIANGVITKDNLYTATPNGFDIYSAKVDFTKPYFRNGKIETGVKASSIVSDNDSRFYFDNGPRVLDSLRTNHFKYEENIYAAYFNGSTSLNKNWILQAGLRVEQTVSTGRLITTGVVNKRNYTGLFPSLFLQQQVNKNYSITYNYSRRLQRPNYGSLNPFISYRDPFTYWQGNPYLRPQYIHAFGVNQTIKKVYNLIFNYNLTKDVIAEIPRLDIARTTTIYYIGNVDDAYSISLSAVAPFRIMKKWDTQNTLTLSQNQFNMETNMGPVVNEQFSYSLQSNHTVQLPESIRMEMTFVYRGPSAWALYKIKPQARMDIGFKKSIFKKKVDVAINASDLFQSQRLKIGANLGGNVNDFDQYFRTRIYNFSLRWNFSKGLNVDTKRRANSVDELNRT